jgi:hypothetical protein
MAKWDKEIIKLRPDHGWKGKEGYRIFVADRGAVRFNVPQDWVMEPDPDSIKFYDRQTPDDNCRLAVSYIRLPLIDWSGLPLSHLVQAIVVGDHRKVSARGEMREVARADLELAWTEIRFTDPVERRDAFSRISLGRGSGIQSLITFDFWADDAARFAQVWDEVMRSLQLGRFVSDPAMGDVTH